MKKHVVSFMFAFVVFSVPAGPRAGADAPDKASVVEIGARAAEYSLGRGMVTAIADYRVSCTRYGVLMFAETAGKPELREELIRLYWPFKVGLARPVTGHVDLNVHGIVPLELYLQTGEERYKKLGLRLANDEYGGEREDGLSDYTRFWVDDMYMVGALQTQAYRATGEREYIDRATRQLLAYSERLQQENGLLWHTEEAPWFWGRGNGWAAASMTEALLAMPADHPDRAGVMESYKLLMTKLLELQHESGMWHQLLDEPESYLETSATAMFVFAMAAGAKEGWLGEEYREAALRGWNALTGYVTDDGAVTHSCAGTVHKDSKEWYMDRPVEEGGLHSQAAFLWAASAIYKL